MRGAPTAATWVAADLQVLLDFFARGRKEAGTFDGGIDMALRRILASPKFLLRVEPDPAGVAPGAAYRLSDLALASRLSFFLWSSIPDDDLLNAAAKGELKKPAVLDRQVRRMLADPKAHALVENFAGQWLHLRNLRNKQPNSFQFPDFDDDLRRAMIGEVELFFDSIVHEDRNVLDLMTADYSFVNERLARHYDIPGIYGSQFRRVTLPDDARRGLLGKGAILLATSHAHRTSPVLRGKWVLENIIGVSPAPPPDNVPALSDDEKPEKPRSGREALEQHRANPTCASCHRVMDPIGFALENFDAVGAWRVKDGGTLGDSIDASGQLADGTRVDGVVALRNALVREPETFVRTMTEKLLTYAVGRGLTASDMPVVRATVRDARAENYRFSSLVLGIVRSVPFQMRTAADTANEGVGKQSASLPAPRGVDGFVKIGRGSVHVHHQTVVVASGGPQGDGCHADPPVPRCDGSRGDGPGEDRRAAVAPVRRRVRADGRAARLLDAGDHGIRIRVHADPEADREIPRQPGHRLEPGSAARWHPRGQHLDVAHRIGAEADRGRGLLRRHLARSDGRRPDRQGHGVSVARNRHRGPGGLHRRVRRGLQLRLHEHDRVAGADHAAADGNQSARRLRADVRASGHARRIAWPA